MSRLDLKVGKIYDEKTCDGLIFVLDEQRYEKYRFMVLRIATAEEYLQECIKAYGPDIDPEFWGKYYEISMD